MKNWFMSKSIAVRSAIVVLALALVTEAGVGAYWLATRKAPEKTVVSSIENETSVESEEPAKTEEIVKETPVAEPVQKEENTINEDDSVIIQTYYEKTSTALENGDFSDGINAWEVYSYVLDNINYTTADGCFAITMAETGTEDWHVQLKQTGVRLEKGKWYTISLDAKSDINRSIICQMQRDGMIHNDDWTPYANAKELPLTSGWKTFNFVFRMPENTDDASVFNISLGAVNGKKITTEHTVSIDNISLTKLPDNWTDSLKSGDNLIGNPNFEYEDTLWEPSVVAPGAATVSFEANKAIFDISNVGTVDWHVQLKQGGIKLDNNTGYRVTFTVSSSVARTIKLGFMDTEYVNWYGGGDIVLNGTDNQEVTVDFYNSIASEANALMMLSMGKIDGVATPAGKITFSNFKLVKCSEVGPEAGGNNGGGGWTDPNHHLSNGWVAYDHESSHTRYIVESNGVIDICITNTGSEDWHVQLQNKNISLKKGKYYKISYDAKSSVARDIGVAVQRDGADDNDWTPYTTGDNKQALTTGWKTYSKTFKMTQPSDAHAIYNFSLGKVGGKSVADEHVVSFRNISIVETSAPTVPDPVIGVGDDILKNGSFDSNSGWETGAYSGGEADFKFKDGKAIIKVTNPGTKDWNIQLKQSPVKLEKGAKYKITLNGTSTVERTVKVAFLNAENTSIWYGGGDFTLSPASAGNATADGAGDGIEFTMGSATNNNAMFAISMGKIEGEATPNSTITLESVSVVKIADPEPVPETVKVTLDQDPENPSQYKGTLVAFDDLSQYVGDYYGKDIKVTVKIVASGYFGGVIGGMCGGEWKPSDTFSSSSAGTFTWSHTLKNVTGGGKVDIYWSQKQEIEYFDLKIEIVDSEDPEDPEEEPWTADIVDNQVNVDIPNDIYNLSSFYGKTVKITAVVEGDGEFKGAIGGGSDGDPDWVSGTESDFASSHTWEVTIPAFKSYAQIQVYWATTATKITIKSVTIVEVTGGSDPEDPEDPEEDPWTADIVDNQVNVDIPGDTYNLSSFYGKTVKITAVVEGDGDFKGAIGGSSDGDPDWVSGTESDFASSHTWEVTIPAFKSYAQIQVYWATTATKITIKSVTIVEVTGGSGPEDPEDPEEDPWTADIVGNQVNVEIPDDIYNLSSFYGKTVKITAEVEGDGDFKGAIGGGSDGDPDWVSGTESDFASSHTWEVTIPAFKSYAQIQVYWATTATKITIKSVTIEEITAPTGSAEALVVKNDADEKNEEVCKTEVEAVVEAEEEESEEENTETSEVPDAKPEETDVEITDAE